MIDTLQRLIAGKRVVILGYGREGKSTLRLLRQAGGYASLAVADKASVSGDELAAVSLHTGEDYQAALSQYDLIFKSPGIVLEHPDSAILDRLTSQTEVFLQRYRAQTIGITGTKGKSTTTTLLHHVLCENGVNALLAGNIGIPVFDLAERMTADAVAVVELSCHQLEYARTAPHIALYLNLYEEHLDHYGTLEAYRAAKERIYRCQKAEDLLICREDLCPRKPQGEVCTFGSDKRADITVRPDGFDWLGTAYRLPQNGNPLIGAHNVANIAAAFAAAQRLGVDWEGFVKALKTYQTLPHRLQPVGCYGGITFVDDSISTICESTIQALQSLPQVGSVLIGGMDRGIDYLPLEDYLHKTTGFRVILMYETGSRIYQEMQTLGWLPEGDDRILLAADLSEAVALAKKITPKGNVCLLSPAAASYGFFKNFEERGEVFARLAKADSNRFRMRFDENRK